MKTYDSYKDSGIQALGLVPTHWKRSKFKFNHRELDFRVGEDWNDFPLLSLTKRGVILRDVNSGKGKFPESFDQYKKVYDGNLIFCLYDIEETPRTVGLSNLDGMITGSYKIFSSVGVLPKFTYYTFLCIDNVKGLKPHYTGMRNVVRPETFKSLPFHYPPVSEQQQIVSFLDTKTLLINSLIEKTQRKIELLREKRTSLINVAVTKGLNPNVELKDSGVEWIGEIPSNWIKSRIKHISTSINGYSFNSDEFDIDNEVPVIRISNIGKVFDTDKCIKISSEYLVSKKEYIVRKNDILIALTGGTIGKSGLYNSDSVALLNQRVGILRNNKDILNRYLWFYIQSESFNEYIHYYCYGGGQDNISMNDILNMVIPLPPINEQEEIVRYLDEITSTLEQSISVELDRLKLLLEYRQSLVSSVVTGKFKVTEDA